MLGAELTHILLSLGKHYSCQTKRICYLFRSTVSNNNFIISTGEKLTEAEVDEVSKDCMDPEDEDGMVPYVRKYSNF